MKDKNKKEQKAKAKRLEKTLSRQGTLAKHEELSSFYGLISAIQGGMTFDDDVERHLYSYWEMGLKDVFSPHSIWSVYQHNGCHVEESGLAKFMIKREVIDQATDCRCPYCKEDAEFLAHITFPWTYKEFFQRIPLSFFGRRLWWVPFYVKDYGGKIEMVIIRPMFGNESISEDREIDIFCPFSGVETMRSSSILAGYKFFKGERENTILAITEHLSKDKFWFFAPKIKITFPSEDPSLLYPKISIENKPTSESSDVQDTEDRIDANDVLEIDEIDSLVNAAKEHGVTFDYDNEKLKFFEGLWDRGLGRFFGDNAIWIACKHSGCKVEERAFSAFCVKESAGAFSEVLCPLCKEQADIMHRTRFPWEAKDFIFNIPIYLLNKRVWICSCEDHGDNHILLVSPIVNGDNQEKDEVDMSVFCPICGKETTIALSTFLSVGVANEKNGERIYPTRSPEGSPMTPKDPSSFC